MSPANTNPNQHKKMKTKLTHLLAAALAVAGNAYAGTPDATPQKPEKPPPLPLHQIEGNGGVFATLSAYLVNPPRNGEPIGRPSLGFSYVHLGYGRDLQAVTLTETPWERLELGYGLNNFDLGDLPQDIQNATTIQISDDAVQLHNFNARLQILKENEFGQKWLPAVTAGVHYKLNTTIDNIDRDLLGTLRGIGIEDDHGIDFTLYASKLLTGLPRPVLINAGARATKAAHNGLLGFTSDYQIVLEGNLALFLTDKLILAAEYKQKPNEYTAIPGLIASEDDWWTVDLAYVVNNHFTVAVGYGNFGSVLNHDANAAWGVTTKFEF